MIHNPILSQMTRRDIEATYSDTYLQFETRDSDGLFPARVIEVSSDDSMYMIVRTLDNDIRYIPLEDKSVRISFDFPKLGNFNHRKHSWYVTRNAMRQWKKGLRPHLLNKSLQCSYILDELNLYENSFDSSALLAMYNPKYTPFIEAFESVEGGDYISRAVSPEFSISNTYNSDKPILLYKGRAVGFFDNGILKIPEDLAFIQPMIERIVPNGYNNSVLI